MEKISSFHPQQNRTLPLADIKRDPGLVILVPEDIFVY
jgi:hypothetical protein